MGDLTCQCLSRFHHSESGGAYTLSYVMVLPMLMLVTCLVIETTLMMSAKVGTVYAAYSGARTGVVWASASNNWSEAEDRIKQAAVQSFVPFASGTDPGASPAERTSDYVNAYSSYADQPVAANYVRNKYANAVRRLSVTTNGPPSSHDSDIQVTVKYQFRFNVPGIGKLLGEPDGDGYFYPLISSVKLQNEGPKNARQELGIGYGTLD